MGSYSQWEEVPIFRLFVSKLSVKGKKWNVDFEMGFMD
jgi:hypothetical protein